MWRPLISFFLFEATDEVLVMEVNREEGYKILMDYDVDPFQTLFERGVDYIFWWAIFLDYVANDILVEGVFELKNIVFNFGLK